MRNDPPADLLAKPCLIDGWPVNIATSAGAIAAAIAAARAGQGFTLFTLNLDHLVKLRRDAGFRAAYRGATYVTADGAPIVLLARLLGTSLERVTGADLVVPLAEAAAAARIPVFLFGTTDDILARAGRRLAERTDHTLAIAGTLSPPAGFDPTGPIAEQAIERIRASGARLCFVALGAPKQEIFAAFAQSKGIDVGVVGIGAALDFIAGEQVRAPRVLREHGLEWLWRLATSPRRLGARYAQCALLLAWLLVRLPLQRVAIGPR